MNAWIKRNHRAASTALLLALLLVTCAGDPPLLQRVYDGVAGSIDLATSLEGVAWTSAAGGQAGEDQASSGTSMVFDLLAFGSGTPLDSAVAPRDLFEKLGLAGEEDLDGRAGAGTPMLADIVDGDALGWPIPSGKGPGQSWFTDWGLAGGIGGAALLSDLPGAGAGKGAGSPPAFGKGAGSPPAFGKGGSSFADHVSGDDMFEGMPPFVEGDAAAAVPEPSAWALLLTALIGLVLMQRRRRGGLADPS